ncbi:MAG: prepilin-type N-terminal cleavage/methylation domain-containing protein [Candidatus Omnitrophica bacterium]|nr:prepilin-type N-terminal cleavage/methylation domain-containing protein [Candidatus Omnitrophota bacterium]
MRIRPFQGWTLIEVVIVLLLFAVLLSAAAMSLNPILLAWSSHQDRMNLQRQIQLGLERGIRDLRLAGAMQNDATVTAAIRFTVRESGINNSYILYFYNASDAAWDNTYTQSSYQLRKAALTGGIGGTFTYGSGDLLMRDVQPPAASALSVSGSVATLDLTLIRGDETFRLIERVKRRNL